LKKKNRGRKVEVVDFDQFENIIQIRFLDNNRRSSADIHDLVPFVE